MNATSQQMEALKKGNEVRLHNSRVKAAIFDAEPAESRRMAADVIAGLESDSPEGRILVTQLLQSVRRAGETRVHRWIGGAGIVSTRRIGGLSDRQKKALIGLLLDDANRIERKTDGKQ